MAELAAVILAAGKGTRMKSDLPKVLHKLNGKHMVSYVLEAVRGAGVDQVIVVVGHGAEQVRSTLDGKVTFALQEQQLGTGHAVLQTEEGLRGFKGDVLVLCGDTPLITEATISELVSKHRSQNNAATVLTALMDNPTGYGRVIRNSSGSVEKIVEQKDASPEEQAVTEINSGMYCFQSEALFWALGKITPANAQGEYYLTDVLEILKHANRVVGAVTVADNNEIMGINDRVQLARADKLIRARVVEQHMLRGVTFVDPDNVYIEDGVSIGIDAVIYPGCFLEGQTTIGDACVVGPNTRIKDSQLAQNVNVQYSVLLEAKIGSAAVIGPYAFLRPGTVLGEGVKVGDFVEIKNSFIGDGSKVPHLSYVGDSDVGKKVNIGAGTITCNYDGKKKSRTIIEDGAFIGSNTNLVAPVRIGEGAMTAAGSTVTKEVPGGALIVERAKQAIIPNWTSRKNS